MQLDGTYEFLELSQQDGVMVSNARDRASGKHIQVHLFPSEKAKEANEICRKLLSLPEAVRKQVLKYDKDGESMYFVTEPLPGGESLKQWIERQTGAASTPQPAPGFGAETLSNLRQMGIEPLAFRPVAGTKSAPPPVCKPEMGPPAAPRPTAEPRVRPMRPPEPPADVNFTRMYSSDEIGEIAARGSAVPAPPRPATPAVAITEDFIKLYQGDAPGQSPAPDGSIYPEPDAPPPARGKSGPGLDTFIFNKSESQVAPLSRTPSSQPPYVEQPSESGWRPREPAPIFEMRPVPPPEATPVSGQVAPPQRRVAPAPAFQEPLPQPAPRLKTPPAPEPSVSVQQTAARAIDWGTALLAMIGVLSVAGIAIWVTEYL